MGNKLLQITGWALIIAYGLDTFTGGYVKNTIVDTFKNDVFSGSILCLIGLFLLYPMKEITLFNHQITIPVISVLTLTFYMVITVGITFLITFIFNTRWLKTFILTFLVTFIIAKIIGIILVKFSSNNCINMLSSINSTVPYALFIALLTLGYFIVNAKLNGK